MSGYTETILATRSDVLSGRMQHVIEGLAEDWRWLDERIDKLSTEMTHTLDQIAKDVHLSRSALRDLLSWARNDAEPRLFTNPGAGRRGGRLTPEARALLKKARP